MQGSVTLNLNGYTDIPSGKIASVVTWLEMEQLDMVLCKKAPGKPNTSHLELCYIPHPSPKWYKELFFDTGAPWLWFSRLKISDDDLVKVISSPDVEVVALCKENVPVGFLELDWRVPSEVEIAFIGVESSCIGEGAGSLLMDYAMARVWRRGALPARRIGVGEGAVKRGSVVLREAPMRLFVHTCSLDHPGALGFYQRYGFRAYQRSIEVVDDPRLTGVLPERAAPQCPII